MSSFAVFYRRPQPSAFMSGLDSGLSLFLIRENRPVISIRPDRPAPGLTEPSDPGSGRAGGGVGSSEPDAASQEETLGQHPGSLQGDAEDAETGAHSPPPVSLGAEESVSSAKSGNGAGRPVTTSGSSSAPPPSPALQSAEEDAASPQRQKLRASQDPESSHQGTTRLQAELSEDPLATGDSEDMVETAQPVVSQAEIHLVGAPVAAPPLPPPAEPVCTHQEDIMGTETNDLQKRVETLVFDLVRVSGVRYVSAAFRYEVARNLVRFAQTSQEACALVRETLDGKMLQLQREEKWEKKLIDLNKVIKRFSSIFVNMKCCPLSWILDDPEDPEDLSHPPPAADPDLEDPSVMVLPSPAPSLEGPSVMVLPSPAPDLEDPSVMVLPSPDPDLEGPSVMVLPSPAPSLEGPSVMVLPSPAPGLEDPSVMVLPSPAPGLEEPPVREKAVRRRLRRLSPRDWPSPAQHVRPQAQTPSVEGKCIRLTRSYKRRAPSTSQQQNEDKVEEMEMIAKKPRL